MGTYCPNSCKNLIFKDNDFTFEENVPKKNNIINKNKESFIENIFNNVFTISLRKNENLKNLFEISEYNYGNINYIDTFEDFLEKFKNKFIRKMSLKDIIISDRKPEWELFPGQNKKKEKFTLNVNKKNERFDIINTRLLNLLQLIKKNEVNFGEYLLQSN